jgi:hypothetical protein
MAAIYGVTPHANHQALDGAARSLNRTNASSYAALSFFEITSASDLAKALPDRDDIALSIFYRQL